MVLNQWLVNKGQRNAFFTVLIAIIILIVNGVIYSSTKEFQYQTDIQKTQDVLSKLEDQAHQVLEDFISQTNQSSLSADQFYSKANSLESAGVDFYIEQNGSLIYWSNNHINPNRILGNGFYKFSNGWYELMVEDTLSKRFYATINIKKVYSYQNKYLQNDFNPIFPLDKNWELSPEKEGNQHQLTGYQDVKIYLDHSRTGVRNGPVFIFFDVLGVILLLAGLFIYFINAENKTLAMILFPFLLVVVKSAMLIGHFPFALYATPLFNQEVVASSTISIGTGELLLWVLCYLLIIIFFYRILSKKLKNSKSKITAITSLSAAIIASLVLELSFLVIEEFVKHSQVTLDFSDILDFNVFSIISFCLIALVLTCLFLIIELVVTAVVKTEGKIDFIFWMVCLVIHVLFALMTMEWIFLVPMVILVIHAWNKRKLNKYNLSSIVITLIIYSVTSALVVETEVQEKEWEFRKAHANNLATDRDFIAEKLFDEFKVSLYNDPILSELMNQPWDKREELNDYIKKYYFKSYWDRFDLQITGALPTDSMIIQPDNELVHCDTYFNQLVVNQGEEVTKDLIFLKNKQGRASYLARIKVEEIGNLYIELDSKLRPEGLGFPELLMDQRLQDKNFLNKYNYARYYKNELVNTYGAFPYPLHIVDGYLNYNGEERLFQEGKDHLIYRYGKDTILVVSANDEGWWSWITSFSYQFCFFGLFTLVFFGCWNWISKGGQLELDFKDRLQFSMLTILLLSLIMVAIGSVYYLMNQNEVKNHDTIKEKLESVRIEIEHKLGEEENLSISSADYIQYLMLKFSKVFFTDISLYDNGGSLLASSQPRIFAEGLTSTMINPEAYEKIAFENKSLFIHREQVGDMSYLSAYVPFLNYNNEPIAILNLPYFSKQTELQGQINKFLVAIINIYVLLIVLSILGTVFIYQRLTRPLRLIKEKIGQIQLGKTNELIEWKGKDEIGDLVREYNRLIIELSESATLLAQSEREGAWKEMARQVAHEIKNPLTPMKLSIQHLMRIADPNDPDFEEKVKKVAKNLITQIDTLSNIANEFSSFAKLPDPVIVELDLAKLLRGACELFDEDSRYQLEFSTAQNEVMVMADKDQTMRIFNNVIKNAIQSIPSERKGVIKVKLELEEGYAVVSCQDNGTGISEEIQQKIFVPNFTTKTSGSGLGLAMVKSMIELMEGRIWFETVENEGTTFYLKFPLIADN